MLCKIINLKRASDRRERVVRYFETHGIKFELVAGKDKMNLSEQDFEAYSARNSKFMNWKHTHFNGLLVCWLSHRKVWEQSVNDEVDILPFARGSG